GRLLGGREDVDVALAVAAAELDRAVDRREHGVVAAQSGACPGIEPRAALADDDRARRHILAGEHLDPEPLRVGVAAVLRGTEALLMRHLPPPPAAPARRPPSCASAASW